jgi:hypothetical protein
MNTMIDVDSFTDEMLIAKGKYAVFRSRHQKAINSIHNKTGELTFLAANIGKVVRDNGNLACQISEARAVIDEIERINTDVQILTDVLAELRPVAWPKGEDENG